MQLRPIAPSEIDLIVGWLTDERNEPWLDFTRGRKQIDAVALKIMLQRDTHMLRIYTSDESAEPIGLVGLGDIHPTFKSANLWALLGDKRLSRAGYTVRAVSEILRLAFCDLGLATVQAWTVEQNRPARRILEQLRFRYVGRLRRCHRINGRPCDRLLYDLLAEEYVEERISGLAG